jgi:hypothetical protein
MDEIRYYLFHNVFQDALSNCHYKAPNYWVTVNDELKGTWKGPLMPCFSVPFQHLFGGKK